MMMANAQTVPAAAGLLPFLEILRAAAESIFQWSSAELAAAFEWAKTVQQLSQQLQGSPAAAALHATLQGTSVRLPPWLAECGTSLADRPRAALLSVLLQRAPPDERWLQLVVGGYVSTCVLPLHEADRAGAEADLTEVLVQQGQQQLLGLLSSTLVAESAAARVMDHLAVGAQRESRTVALQYFTSAHTLEAAAAGQLLLQALESDAVMLQSICSPKPSLAEMEVLCLAVLVRGWEGVLWRLQHGRRDMPGDMNSAHCQLASGQAVVQLLCMQLEMSGELVLQLPPPLVAEVCRESFRFACGFVALLQQCQAERAEVLHLVAAHTKHLLQYDDMVSKYTSRKLKVDCLPALFAST